MISRADLNAMIARGDSDEAKLLLKFSTAESLVRIAASLERLEHRFAEETKLGGAFNNGSKPFTR